MNIRFLILLLALSLVGCTKDDSAQTVADAAATSKTDDSAVTDNTVADAAATAESSTSDGFTSVDATPATDTSVTPAATDDAEVTNNEDNSSDGVTADKLTNGYVYTTHDAYHQVTCWYVYGNQSLSCLPDSEVSNVKK